MARGETTSLKKYGCLGTLALAAIALIVLGIAVAAALRQNRSATFERKTLAQEVSAPSVTPQAPPGAVRLKLNLHTAGLSVRPIDAGEPIRIDADYDPKLYALDQRAERRDGAVLVTVELQPLGSSLMALLRVKLGGRPARLRIGLPRGVPLELDGDLARSFAAMELGGLSVTSARLDVRDGGVKVSFDEPLPAPMESLSIVGNRGSLSLVGLGNASPRNTRLLQHIGALDLDLRGAWSADAEVQVIGGVAGGSLWLPDNVRILGLEDRDDVFRSIDPELPPPTLKLSISETMGRVVVMD